MSQRDPYEILGVQKTASKSEIKRAYQKLAMKYHPDRAKGDKKAAEEKFREADYAYKILSDEKKRAHYDQFGTADFAGGMGGAGAGFSDFASMFEDMFGMGGQSRSSRSSMQKGDDLLYKISIELEEAIFGSKKTLNLPIMSECNSCTGSGAKPGSKLEDCRHCGGSGSIHIQQGFIALQQTCPNCRGQGVLNPNPCHDCSGSGRVNKKTEISLSIPAGIDDGDRLRLRGKGEAGANGGPNGDLYVEISVKPHKLFTRNGQNLHCKVHIDLFSAALGANIEVPTITGKVVLKIPPETQTNSVFRLRARGVQATSQVRAGDLLCEIIVETPVKLTSKQKQLLSDFKDSITDKNSPKASGWYNSIKQFFGNNSV